MKTLVFCPYDYAGDRSNADCVPAFALALQRCETMITFNRS